jgi:hypothetical protein
MKPNLIVWDLETVPDLGPFAAANDLVGKSDVEVRAAIGDNGALFIVGHLLEDSRLFPRSDRGNKPCVPRIYDEGQAYTETEYRKCLAEAGFSDICVQYGAAAGGASIVVAREKD